MLPLAVLFGAATARIAAPDLLDRMSLICFDLYQRAAPRIPEADTPVRIVDIDDDSLKKIGQWPWPRTLVAQLIDKLRETGAISWAQLGNWAPVKKASARSAPSSTDLNKFAPPQVGTGQVRMG